MVNRHSDADRIIDIAKRNIVDIIKAFIYVAGGLATAIFVVWGLGVYFGELTTEIKGLRADLSELKAGHSVISQRQDSDHDRVIKLEAKYELLSKQEKMSVSPDPR